MPPDVPPDRSAPVGDARRRAGAGLSERVQAWAVRALYAAGWRLSARVPRRGVRALIERAARRVAADNGRHVRTLRLNLSVTLGRTVDDRLIREALASHFRNVYEQLALPGAVVPMVARVTTTGLPPLRAAMAGPGAVLALPHSGNWDLAGAWACRSDLPVSTVAERLKPAEFAAFLRFRTGLGMEVVAHDDPAALPAMVSAIGRHRMVCLLSDRDLKRTGVPVTWAGESVTMPAGPALVAQRSGATLFAVVSQYTGRPGAAGEGMVLHISPPIATRPGSGGAAAMMQDVADVFVDRIREQPQDWHMLQRFFDRPAG